MKHEMNDAFTLWYSLTGCRANVSPEDRLRLAFEAGQRDAQHTPLTTAEWLKDLEETE